MIGSPRGRCRVFRGCRNQSRRGRPPGRQAWVEPLEGRIAPATLTLAGGDLTYEAAFGEANILTVDLVNVNGADFVRFREDGVGLTITPSGTGLVADAPNLVRAPLSGLTSIAISTQPVPDPNNPGDPDLVDDSIRLVLENTMPAAISIDAGPSTGDSLTIQGTPGDDSFSAVPSWSSGGARIVELSHASTTVQIGDVEHLTFDIAQAGQDLVQLDRYVAGLDRPGAFQILGGGAGSDSLQITGEGNLPQTVNLSDGLVSIRDTPPTQELLLGRSDNIAIDQPRVTLDVIQYDANGDPQSLIPYEDEGRYFTTVLLDTGATGILAAQELSSTLVDHGMQVDGLYQEQGVAGFSDVGVSAPYRVDFAGVSGVRNTIENFRMELGDFSFSFLGPWGLAGMPLMVNRVTSFDMSNWLDPFGLTDPADLEIGVDFSSQTPPDSGHQYHVPVQLVDFPASGAYPDNPVPTFAPLPEIPVKIRENGREVTGYFLVDTGAQLSILSTQVAFALGLDRNHNGTLEDEAVDHIDVGGIGGTTTIPMLPIDRLAVASTEGADLIWTKLLMGIEDISVPNGPTLLGVFGMDFLTSGWASKILPLLLGTPGSLENGYFSHIYLDFRNADAHQGTIIFDVVPEHDNPGQPIASTLAVGLSGVDTVQVSTGNGTDPTQNNADDIFNVSPSIKTRFVLDAGPHTSGDTLNVSLPDGLSASNDGSTIQVAGYQDIGYSHFEHVNIANNIDTTPPTAAIDPVTPDPRRVPVPAVTIQFSEPVLGFDLGDLALTRDGSPVSLADAHLITTDNVHYTLSGLDTATTAPGLYLLTLNASGSGILDLAGNPLAASATDDWRMLDTMIVTSFAPTASGFVLTFDRPIDPSVLNLYDTQFSGLGPADVSLVGGAVGPVPGSVVLDTTRTTLRFMARGGILPNDNYTVHVRSATDGLHDASGNLLDGNEDGVAGGDYAHTFNVAHQVTDVVLGVPDVVRGPSQDIHIPATDTTVGIPITIDNAAGVSTIELTVHYDPTLLNILDATTLPGLSGTLAVTDSGTGYISYLLLLDSPLPAGPLTLLSLTASVPASAPYGTNGAITLSNLSFDLGQRHGVADDGLQVVGFFGDADGSRSYNAYDASLIGRVALNRDAGFAAWPLTDPLPLADINGNGALDLQDAQLVASKSVSRVVPQIPDLPAGQFSGLGGADVILGGPPNLATSPGQTILLPPTGPSNAPTGRLILVAVPFTLAPAAAPAAAPVAPATLVDLALASDDLLAADAPPPSHTSLAPAQPLLSDLDRRGAFVDLGG